jgi:hypothetical protein
MWVFILLAGISGALLGPRLLRWGLRIRPKTVEKIERWCAARLFLLLFVGSMIGLKSLIPGPVWVPIFLCQTSNLWMNLRRLDKLKQDSNTQLLLTPPLYAALILLVAGLCMLVRILQGIVG